VNNLIVILIGIGVLLTTVGYLYLYIRDHRVIELIFALGSMLLGGIMSATPFNPTRLLPALLFFALLMTVLVVRLTRLVPPTSAIPIPRALLVALLGGGLIIGVVITSLIIAAFFRFR
jgi:hypothetical protein